jgi:hypothetical protein
VIRTLDPEKVVGPDLVPYARQIFREAGWRQQADDGSGLARLIPMVLSAEDRRRRQRSSSG